MKKVIVDILVTIYAIIAVATTICLLSYNEYKVSEFGDYSLIIIPNNEISSDFKTGNLVIVNGSAKNKYSAGDKVFFYNAKDNSMDITLGEIQDTEVISSKETTYTIEGDYSLSSEYVIGKASGSTIIPVVGGILGVLESRWGFLFLIVFPSLLAFIYEIVSVISDARKNKKAESKE